MAGTVGYHIQVQTGQYTGRRVTNSRFQFLGTQGEHFLRFLIGGKSLFFKKRFMVDVSFEPTTNSSSPFDDAICRGSSQLGYRTVKVNQSPTAQTTASLVTRTLVGHEIECSSAPVCISTLYRYIRTFFIQP